MTQVENMKEGLWLTSGGRIVRDDHYSEAFATPFDKKIMTKEELSNGVNLKEFMRRLRRK